jgi:hypothetical protein
MADLNFHCIMMLRNESDIIGATLNHALALFDTIWIVDIQSTDGSRETLEDLARREQRVRLYSCKTQEKYQGVMMDRLSRAALAEGADWIFFFDGDEFLNIESRKKLQAYMQEFTGDVMHMPWMNLIPTTYGTFDHFDMTQTFYWSGRVSPYRKVAISRLYCTTNPEFHLQEGNHNVTAWIDGPGSREVLGLTMLHVPIRSIDRLKYKLSNALRLLATKHTWVPGEGTHVQQIMRLISEGGSRTGYLNQIASSYGANSEELVELDCEHLKWPSLKFPAYVNGPPPAPCQPATLTETMHRDAVIEWEKGKFTKGIPVSAQIDGDQIIISAQPMRGSGERVMDGFGAFKAPNPAVPKDIDLALLTEIVSASFVKIDILRYSAWSRLIPLLYAIMALSRPRRYVELGVHNGMSFFAACQISETLKLDTECVGIDSWVGDPHASFHSSEVLDTFRETIKRHYPDQAYVQGMFRDALPAFEDGSVDLLHIDGYHTYEAVKDDFETWLPKMSGNGIIIFHDINVHERGFGVWRYWDELKLKYPGFGFMHSHGLGVLYVGNQKNAVSKIFDLLLNNREVRVFAQQYFETIGELAVEHRELTDATDRIQASNSEKDAKIREFQGYLAHRDTIIASLEAMVNTDGRETTSGRQQELDWLASQRAQLIAERDNLLARLEQTPRASSSGAASANGLTVNDPALVEARAAGRVPRYPGMLGRLKTFKARRRREQEIHAISASIVGSGLFDSAYYLQTYPDVREAGIDPLRHYIEHGAFELRDPSPGFSSGGYLQNNRDVLKAAVNPLHHYIEHGQREGRHW